MYFCLCAKHLKNTTPQDLTINGTQNPQSRKKHSFHTKEGSKFGRKLLLHLTPQLPWRNSITMHKKYQHYVVMISVQKKYQASPIIKSLSHQWKADRWLVDHGGFFVALCDPQGASVARSSTGVRRYCRHHKERIVERKRERLLFCQEIARGSFSTSWNLV